MLCLCQYGILKRMCDFDAKTIIPCYEAFSQLLRVSQQIVWVENCKLKNVTCEILENGMVYNLMRQEGTKNSPRKLPIVIDPEFQRKLIIHFHTFNPTSNMLSWRLHNSSEQVLRMMYNNEFGAYFFNAYQRIFQEIKECTTCSLTFQTIPVQPKGTRIAGTSYGEAPYSHVAIDTIEIGRIRMFR